jgi:epoxyqueuosine reductase
MEAARLKEIALQEGATLVGIADPRMPILHEDAVRSYTSEGRFGPLEWWPKHEAVRLNPLKLLPEAKSLLMIGVAYDGRPGSPENLPRISRYAMGRDYHKTLKKMLVRVANAILKEHPYLNWRATVDSAPLLERYWAWQAGLGWIGKNTLLIHPQVGSWFFLGGLLLDLEVEPDTPHPDRCGTCRACLDACPTDALKAHQCDAARCISAWTIEHRHDDKGLAKPLPSDFDPMPESWIFGCDSCQTCCPWNHKAKHAAHPDFRPPPELLATLQSDDLQDDLESWENLTRGRALRRMSASMYKRNLAAARG